jgi:site-specific recombinase XerC
MTKGFGSKLKKACRKKIRYPSEPAENSHVRPYKCPHCDGWHMVSKSRETRTVQQALAGR